MIFNATGDLLTGDYTHIIHQANLFHTFGSGLALQIKNKYPTAFEEDRRTRKGDKSRLGTFSSATTHDGKVIYNLYSQVGIGSKDRQTNYDAMEVGLQAIRLDLQMEQQRHAEKIRVGIPYKLGCGLANGNWGTVESIIRYVFEDEEYPVTIVRLPGC